MNVRRNGGRGCAREGQHLGTKNNVHRLAHRPWRAAPQACLASLEGSNLTPIARIGKNAPRLR